MNKSNQLALFLAILILMFATLPTTFASEQVTTVYDADLSVSVSEIIPTTVNPFDSQYFTFESIQIRNSGQAPVICKIPTGLDNGDGKISEDEYWATLAYNKLDKDGDSFQGLFNSFILDDIFVNEESLLNGIALLKEKKLITEESALFYTRKESRITSGFCKIKILDSMPGQGSKLIKEFTLDRNLAAGTSVILSTKFKDYVIEGAGMHSIQVIADYDNLLLEKNKDNNVADLQIYVNAFQPDLFFMGSNKIYNRGPAPMLCNRFKINKGVFAPSKKAFGETPRTRVLSYMLLSETIAYAEANGHTWFSGEDMRTVFDSSAIFETYYDDYPNTEKYKNRIFALLSENLLDHENVHPVLKQLGGSFWIADNVLIRNYCWFGDADTEEDVCKDPIALDQAIVNPGSFVPIGGVTAGFSNVNCFALEDSNQDNNLYSEGFENQFIENPSSLETKVSINLELDNKYCDGIVNVYTSTTGTEWGLVNAIPTCPTRQCNNIDTELTISNLFSYIKLESKTCTLKDSSITILDSNYGDPFTRVSEYCGNSYGWSVPLKADDEVIPIDKCSPKIVSHIHYFGGGSEGVNTEKDAVVYLNTPIPSTSNVEILVDEVYDILVGEPTDFLFQLKNKGVKPIDELDVELEFPNDACLDSTTQKATIFNPNSRKDVIFTFDLPTITFVNSYPLTINVKRAGYTIASKEVEVRIVKDDYLLLYTIYGLIGVAAIGLIVIVLKFTGIHEKIFKKKHRRKRRKK